jgi:hypothetical protein
MYKPKKENNPSTSNRQRLPVASSMPGIKQVSAQFEDACAKRGIIVEQPWTTTIPQQTFVLMVQWEGKAEFPLWTLYEENANESKMHWSQTFPPTDVQLMYDVLSMSVESGSHATFKIPDELKPKDGLESLRPEPAKAAPTPEPAPPPPVQQQPAPQQPQGYPQQPQAYPQQQQGFPPQGYPQQQGYPQPQGYPPPGYGQGYPPPMPGYPPPGYPGYPQPGYPQQQQQPPNPNQQSPWQNAPQQQQPQPQQQQQSPFNSAPAAKEINSDLRPIDYNMMSKHSNVLLGTLLVEAGLMTSPTLNAALKIQELVREDKMDQEQAFDALKRLHSMGASIDDYLSPTDFKSGKVATSKPKPTSQATGSGGGAPAASAYGGAKGQPVDPEKQREMHATFDLLQKAALLSENDLKSAQAVRSKHGGDMVNILKSAGKLEMKTYDAALICIRLIHVGKMKVEQCIIALNYCSRSRVGFDEAMEELNWPNPRKS